MIEIANIISNLMILSTSVLFLALALLVLMMVFVAMKDFFNIKQER